MGGSPSCTGSGFDVGAKLGYAGASLLGYYYGGSGIGTTGLFILSTDPLGRKRDSNGFYAYGTYTIGKLTGGVSYGESHLDLTPGEINPTLLDKNSSWVGQLRYGLTPWVRLSPNTPILRPRHRALTRPNRIRSQQVRSCFSETPCDVCLMRRSDVRAAFLF